MKKLRVLVLGNNYSITTATAFAHLLSMEEKIEVAGIVTVKGVIKKKSFGQFLKYSYEKEGFRYLFNKGLMLLRIKMRALRAESIHKNGSRLFYSLDEVSKVHKFENIVISDINSESSVKMIKELNIDVIFSLSFPYILKPHIIDLPNLGSINLHRSFLPKYRGCNPVFWVRAHKEKSTGFSIHYIAEGLDCGDILVQRQIEINPEKDRNLDLMHKFCERIPGAVDEVIEKFAEGRPEGIAQDENEATAFKCPKKKERIKYGIWD